MGVLRHLAVAAMSIFTFGILGALNLIFLLWDPKTQALHDKVVQSIVLRNQEKRPFNLELFRP